MRFTSQTIIFDAPPSSEYPALELAFVLTASEVCKCAGNRCVQASCHKRTKGCVLRICPTKTETIRNLKPCDRMYTGLQGRSLRVMTAAAPLALLTITTSLTLILSRLTGTPVFLLTFPLSLISSRPTSLTAGRACSPSFWPVQVPCCLLLQQLRQSASL